MYIIEVVMCLPEGNANNMSIVPHRRLLRLTLKRNNRIKDYMHKVSKLITSYCIIDRIDTVVIGKNKQNKNKINIGGVNNQNFVQIPHVLFVKPPCTKVLGIILRLKVAYRVKTL